jgi:hypothetical protein
MSLPTLSTLPAAVLLLVIGSAMTEASESPSATSTFHLVEHANPTLRINELFPACEDLRNPAFAALRERYDLDAVVAGIDDEFSRILALRHWIKGQIRIEDDNPTQIRHQYVVDILDAAQAGGGFHCAHFSIVQDAIFNAYGYVTRRLGAGDGRIERGRHHGVNEVWVNSLCKWVLIDAKYDLHFEKDGVPLSALDMREEVLRDGGTSVTRVYGPSREPLVKEFPESMETYRWISWEMNTNRFSIFPTMGSSALVLFEDDFSRANRWYRDGKPHWAYGAEFFVKTTKREWIEWTPNVVASHVTIQGNQASIWLASCTPNLRSYQIQLGDSAWTDCADTMHIPIPAAGIDIRFRAENLAEVRGPLNTVVIRPQL